MLAMCNSAQHKLANRAVLLGQSKNTCQPSKLRPENLASREQMLHELADE